MHKWARGGAPATRASDIAAVGQPLHLSDDVELFDCDLVDLVHDIDARAILPVALIKVVCLLTVLPTNHCNLLPCKSLEAGKQHAFLHPLTGLKRVNDVVHRGITSNRDLGIGDAILSKNLTVPVVHHVRGRF